MKTIENLIFSQYVIDPILEKVNPGYAEHLKMLKHAELTFQNGYAVSILHGYLHRDTPIGYSIAVFKDGERVYNTGFDRWCVELNEIAKSILDIQSL